MIAAAKTEIDLGAAGQEGAATALTNLQKAYNNSGVQKLTEEYVKGADKLSLETADVKSVASSTNKFYDQDECGTLSRIPDSLSNVYVRTYVDFGNGLVVYSEPRAIESASAQLAAKLNLQVAATVEGEATKYTGSGTANTSKKFTMIAQRTDDDETIVLKQQMSNMNGRPHHRGHIPL